MSDDPDPLDQLPDYIAAAAFRRLVRHLRHRHDAQNIELMGLAGFCRNCLADWVAEASEEYPADTRDWMDARGLIYGMSYADWKKRYSKEATPEQIAAMKASVAKNA